MTRAGIPAAVRVMGMVWGLILLVNAAASTSPSATVAPDGSALPGLTEFARRKNPLPRSLAAQARVRNSYVTHCAPCHGPAGRGDGPYVAAFPPGQRRPRDFTTGEFQYGSADGLVMRTIWKGVPGTMMAGWQGRIDMNDAWALVHYVKGLARSHGRAAGHAGWWGTPSCGGSGVFHAWTAAILRRFAAFERSASRSPCGRGRAAAPSSGRTNAARSGGCA